MYFKFFKLILVTVFIFWAISEIFQILSYGESTTHALMWNPMEQWMQYVGTPGKKTRTS